jgi:urea carboxylase
VRLYAEDPAKNFQPSAGLLTEVVFPADARVDGWVERGTEVPAWYDPMLAKLIVTAPDRTQALAKLDAALAATRLAGIETNLEYLRQVVRDPLFREGRQVTRFLNGFHFRPATVEVIEPGVQTSVQDWPGRLGHWDVGVPPSGPMDAYAHRMANRLVGNSADAAALEVTLSGPTLRFNTDAVIAVTGATARVTLDGQDLAMWQSHRVVAGSVLTIGRAEAGCRLSVAVGGGFDVPLYLGSRSTFTLGQFGGHAGRHLRIGDVLHLAAPGIGTADVCAAPATVPAFGHHWEVGVLYGPHGAPDFFTADDVDTFFATDWEVHYNSSRTGVRLLGPRPQWARTDGGEAGLHPSNIHDNAYAIGAIDFTGDMPVILGPDGPSLGGFVCPAVVVDAELWKLGQLRPGDTVRFHRLSLDQALDRSAMVEATLATLNQRLPARPIDDATAHSTPVILDDPARAEDSVPAMVVRQAGDRYLLVEFGPLVLDIELRLRVHVLMQALRSRIDACTLTGIVDMTPGIRSLQLHFDPTKVSRETLIRELVDAEASLPAVDDMVVPSRTIYLPLSWDDPQTKLAIEKYSQSVRPDAPWCPSNIEFIRRINGLDSIDEVFKVVFEASYLVLGLGDVYLGAPVATPVDPRHRLVTTKYNPARTWTPENAVGIGGAYLCVYGMEGPGGYQFVGRTLQMWNRWRHGQGVFTQPWLLRFFDQIRFVPVSQDELLRIRAEFPHGGYALRIEDSTFSLKDYRQFLTENAPSISAFKAQQQIAFDAERERWAIAGQDVVASDADLAATDLEGELHLPAGGRALATSVPGSVWKVTVEEGQRVKAGEVLMVIESMKMEFNLLAPADATVHKLMCQQGAPVSAGQNVLVLVDTEVVAA